MLSIKVLMIIYNILNNHLLNGEKHLCSKSHFKIANRHWLKSCHYFVFYAFCLNFPFIVLKF